MVLCSAFTFAMTLCFMHWILKPHFDLLQRDKSESFVVDLSH